MENIVDLVNSFPKIGNQNKYWFVRTMGGKLYSAFVFKNMIAIDFSKIEEEEITDLISGDISQKKIECIKGKYEKHKRPGLIITYLKEFYKEMKIGDYVVIPDVCGNNIAVGKIESNVEIIDGIERIRKDGKIVIDSDYKRIRRIKWLSVAKRDKFSPYLYRLLNSHLTISSAEKYDEWIDLLLHSAFEKNGKYHYIVNIEQKFGLQAKAMYGAFYEILSLTDDFLISEGIKEDTNSIETRIVASSPGYTELLGSAGCAIAIIILIILFINGGGFKLKTKDGLEIDLSSEGIIKRLNEFLNSRKDRILKTNLAEKVKSLDIKEPKEIVALLEAVNEKNQND